MFQRSKPKTAYAEPLYIKTSNFAFINSYNKSFMWTKYSKSSRLNVKTFSVYAFPTPTMVLKQGFSLQRHEGNIKKRITGIFFKNVLVFKM